MSNISQEYDIFINCPFDSDYKKLFNALIFTIQDCGFKARSALEIDSASVTRFEKIVKIISECRYGIHDISKTELDEENNLPRFNMPLELGLFFGAIKFGTESHEIKKCLILDKERHRHAKFCSDLAGHDIHPHYENEQKLITEVRNWLQSCSDGETIIPGGSAIYDRFQSFLKDLPYMCENLQLEPDELTYADFLYIVYSWIVGNELEL